MVDIPVMMAAIAAARMVVTVANMVTMINIVSARMRRLIDFATEPWGHKSYHCPH